MPGVSLDEGSVNEEDDSYFELNEEEKKMLNRPLERGNRPAAQSFMVKKRGINKLMRQGTLL